MSPLKILGITVFIISLLLALTASLTTLWRILSPRNQQGSDDESSTRYSEAGYVLASTVEEADDAEEYIGINFERHDVKSTYLRYGGVAFRERGEENGGGDGEVGGGEVEPIYAF